MNPSVGVVIPTRGHRPDTLRSAALAVLGQDYPGTVEVVIVVDRGDPIQVTDQMADLMSGQALTAGREQPFPRSVWVMANRLSPGLPGTRNTGIAALGTDLVAFCDDDDRGYPARSAPRSPRWRRSRTRSSPAAPSRSSTARAAFPAWRVHT